MSAPCQPPLHTAPARLDLQLSPPWPPAHPLPHAQCVYAIAMPDTMKWQMLWRLMDDPNAGLKDGKDAKGRKRAVVDWQYSGIWKDIRRERPGASVGPSLPWLRAAPPPGALPSPHLPPTRPNPTCPTTRPPAASGLTTSWWLMMTW